MSHKTETSSTQPTFVAHHHLQFSQEMTQFPQIQELDDFLKKEDIHLTSLFVAKTSDVHPGEIAETLQKMILKSRYVPYCVSIDI